MPQCHSRREQHGLGDLTRCVSHKYQCFRDWQVSLPACEWPGFGFYGSSGTLGQGPGDNDQRQSKCGNPSSTRQLPFPPFSSLLIDQTWTDQMLRKKVN